MPVSHKNAASLTKRHRRVKERHPERAFGRRDHYLWYRHNAGRGDPAHYLLNRLWNSCRALEGLTSTGVRKRP